MTQKVQFQLPNAGQKTLLTKDWKEELFKMFDWDSQQRIKEIKEKVPFPPKQSQDFSL